MTGCALFGCVAALAITAGQTGQQTSKSAAVDAGGIVHSRKLLSGVPLGGVGAGSFQILTDGSFAPLTLPDGFRPNSAAPGGCFAAIWTGESGRSGARALALDSAYGIPVAPAVDYTGRYPVATLDYPDARSVVEARVTAFSPIVPFDLYRSCLPGAVIIVRVHNSGDQTIDVSVALSWQRLLRSYGAGSGAVTVPDIEGVFGIRFPDTSILPDQQFDNGAGGESLMVIPPRRALSVTSSAWSADDGPAWWNRFAQDGTIETGKTRAAGANPAGVIAVKLALKPRDTVEIPFAVSWFVPHDFVPSALDLGHYYQTLFTDSDSVARSLLENWRALFALTQEWQYRLLFSDLPPWMKMRVIDSASVLSTNTILSRDGRFAWVGELGEMAEPAAGEPTSPAGFAAKRIAADALMLDFFPSLVGRELDQTLDQLTPEGLFLASSEPSLLTQPRSRVARREAPGSATSPVAPARLIGAEDVDRATVFVLRALQYCLSTEDSPFLEDSFPRIQRALEYLIRASGTSGMPDALGPEPSSATLWIAALRGGERLSELYEHWLFVAAAEGGISGNWTDAINGAAAAKLLRDQCAQTRAHAEQYLVAQRFNGRYLVGARDDGSTSGQAIGEWAAERLGLPSVLSDVVRGSIISSLRSLNDSQGSFGPLERVPAGHAAPGHEMAALLPVAVLAEAGLYLGSRQAEAGTQLLRKLDSTRNDLQLSPWESPYRFDAETGAVLAPGMGSLAHSADWLDTDTIEGFLWDPVQQRLTISPSIPGDWRSLDAPVSSATFWARIEYKPFAHTSVWSFRLDRIIELALTRPGHLPSGKTSLSLSSVRLPNLIAPPVNRPVGVQVTLRQHAIGSSESKDAAGDIVVTFDTPISMSAGDRLEIDLR